MIRNGKLGDKVYTNYGYGAEALVIERVNLRHKRITFGPRGIYYKVKIVENHSLWHYGDVRLERAKSLKRERAKTERMPGGQNGSQKKDHSTKQGVGQATEMAHEGGVHR